VSRNIARLRSLANFTAGALPKLTVMTDRGHVASFTQVASPWQASIPVRLRCKSSVRKVDHCARFGLASNLNG